MWLLKPLQIRECNLDCIMKKFFKCRKWKYFSYRRRRHKFPGSTWMDFKRVMHKTELLYTSLLGILLPPPWHITMRHSACRKICISLPLHEERCWNCTIQSTLCLDNRNILHENRLELLAHWVSSWAMRDSFSLWSILPSWVSLSLAFQMSWSCINAQMSEALEDALYACIKGLETLSLQAIYYLTCGEVTRKLLERDLFFL